MKDEPDLARATATQSRGQSNPAIFRRNEAGNFWQAVRADIRGDSRPAPQKKTRPLYAALRRADARRLVAGVAAA